MPWYSNPVRVNKTFILNRPYWVCVPTGFIVDSNGTSDGYREGNSIIEGSLTCDQFDIGITVYKHHDMWD